MRWYFKGFSLLLMMQLLLLAQPSSVHGQVWNYTFLRSGNFVQDRNAYLLTLFEIDPTAHRVIANDPVFSSLGSRLRATRAQLLPKCSLTETSNQETVKECPVGDLRLTDSESMTVANELAKLAIVGAPLHALVEKEMRPSGRFQKYAALDDSSFMKNAWLETVKGVNRIYGVYALGQDADEVKDEDDPLYTPGSAWFVNDAMFALSAETDGATSHDLFFQPWSQFGFDLLVIAQRTEAGRYEPLETGANRLAFARARTLDWKKWRYTAIIIPGIGLSPGETHVSPAGTFLVREAARRWREGLAPFIIFSGGHVHPDRTIYSEAVEMKRMAMQQYHIPADAIVIDPYARHTTTNMRNAVRLLFRMHAPMTQPLLITSAYAVSDYIGSTTLDQRYMRVFGFRPVGIVRRISPFDLVALPRIISLHADMNDPLDP